MSKCYKHIFRIIVIASIAGAIIQTVTLAQTQTTGEKEPIRLEPIIVHVYKEPDGVQRLPVSVTGVSESVLRGAGVLKASDAGILAPIYQG